VRSGNPERLEIKFNQLVVYADDITILGGSVILQRKRQKLL
jgi:hypothetical protein